jgi:hypothetical protein
MTTLCHTPMTTSSRDERTTLSEYKKRNISHFSIRRLNLQIDEVNLTLTLTDNDGNNIQELEKKLEI